MKLTNRHLAFLGLAIGGIGLAFEWKNLFPAGLKNPLANRNVGTTPATGRTAVQANANTTGRVSPTGTTTRAAGAGAPRGATSSGSTLTLGSALTPLAGFLGALLKGSSKPDPKASGGGGGASPSSPGGSAGRVDAGRGAAFGNDNTSTAGGSGPQDGSTPYVDGNGWTAYPQGDGTYQDENGNQVYIRDDGTITYDPTQDVGYVVGGEVFPNSYDPNDPSTFDFYGDGGPLAAPDPSSPTPGAFDDTGGVPLAPVDDGAGWPNDNPVDLGAVDPGMFADTGVSDLGGDFGGGDGYDFADNQEFDGF